MVAIRFGVLGLGYRVNGVWFMHWELKCRGSEWEVLIWGWVLVVKGPAAQPPPLSFREKINFRACFLGLEALYFVLVSGRRFAVGQNVCFHAFRPTAFVWEVVWFPSKKSYSRNDRCAGPVEVMGLTKWKLSDAMPRRERQSQRWSPHWLLCAEHWQGIGFRV